MPNAYKRLPLPFPNAYKRLKNLSDFNIRKKRQALRKCPAYLDNGDIVDMKLT